MNFKRIYESSNILFSKITPKYIQNVFKKKYGPGSQLYDYNPKYYEEHYSGEEMELFIKDFEDFLNKIEINGDNLILYRGLHLKSKDDLKTDFYGFCWTVNKELFQNKHCLEAGNINTILKAEIPVSSVNWKETILNFYHYSFTRIHNMTSSYGQRPEFEIRIKKNADVKILDIEYI